jgi:sugar phosphate isomerase/epimerase
MKLSICHYSFHRLWKEETWDTVRLCDEVKKLGVEGVDFHAGMLETPATAVQRMQAGLKVSGLTLSGFSLSTNFLKEKPEDYEKEIRDTREWMRVAADMNAPVSRIFGGSLRDKGNVAARKAGLERVVEALNRLAADAEKLQLTLALENHGGVPCTGEEQVDVLRRVGSKYVRATVDIGNYMSCGQEGLDGTRVAASTAAYVHLKDMKKVADPKLPWGWSIQACTLGKGDVDIPGCLKALKQAGYDGFLALEYEGPDPERTGIPESLACVRRLI